MRALLALVGVMVLAIGVSIAFAFLHPGPSLPSIPDTPKMSERRSPQARRAVFDRVKQGAVRADLQIEGNGTIVLELYPKVAPNTVAHFSELCKRHFYDGILIHRVETTPGVRLFQAGDPTSKKVDQNLLRGKTNDEVWKQVGLGMTGSGSSVPLEPGLPNTPYSLGLAHGHDPDSGDSQFYVNLTDNMSYDDVYCVFGQVISGREIAEKVTIGDRIASLRIEQP